METRPELTTIDPTQRLDRLSPERRALLAKLLQQKAAATPTRPTPAATRPATIVPRPAERHAPFPLTDLQQAYWIGRSGAYELGNMASRAYLELECRDLDVARLNWSWQQLVERHDMLRLVVREDGQQQTLAAVPPYEMPVADLRGLDEPATVARLDETFQAMLYNLRGTEEGHLFDLRVSLLDEHRARLHVCMDLLQVDAGSVAILFRELSRLYADPAASLPPLELTFRDYVLAEIAFQQTEDYQRARQYWMDRLASLPPAPDLPLAADPATLVNHHFMRRVARLDPETTRQVKARAQRFGITTSGLMLAVLAEVLTAWSASPRFTINIPLFNRLPLHPQVNDVVGAFTSVNLLAVDNSASDRFEDRARRIQEQLLDDLDHRQMDGVRVMRELARLHGKAPMPVVFTSLIDVNFNQSVAQLGQVVRSINQTAQVWMDLHVDEEDGGFLLKWDAVDGLFPDGMLEDMLAAYCNVLRHLAAADEHWRDVELPLLPAHQVEARQRLNATEAPVPAGLLHTQVAAVAAQRPDQPAVITPSRTLTYGELMAQANQVGRRLRELGAQPNRPVAIVMEKGWEQAVAVYGALTAGAPYLPIDPDFPKERVWYLLDHGQVELVLTQSWIDARLEWPATVQRLVVDGEAWAGISAEPLAPVQQPTDLAYVLYTSGSTGLPKGVMIEHRSVLHRMLDVNQRFGIGPDDRAMALTALQHDLSVYDLFGMLLAGGTLVMPSAAGRRDPAHWLEMATAHGVTFWNSVPAFMEMFVEYLENGAGGQARPPMTLRKTILSGDWVPVRLPDRLRALLPGIEVISAGGPTETTVWDICYPIGRVDPEWKSIPYGRPMTNARYYILHDSLQPCPDWVTGQLYIGGVGLARGYWRDEERTAASFITHPRTGERLYRSGDLGRFLPGGVIEFMGRADFQVKIGGQRIELGEIEATLGQHPAVRAVVVAAVGEARAKRRLVAYLVLGDGARPTSDELREFVQAKLPQHMVPSAFVVLDRLPLTGNGKVDRKNLPDPGQETAEATPAAREERPTTVGRIAQIVGAVLGIEPPAATANLLSLGANSIDIVKIGNRLEKEFGTRPRMDELFRLQTVAALAGYYDQRQPQARAEAAPAAKATGSPIDALIASYRVLLDPAERDAFKKKQLGIRRDDAGRTSVQFTPPVHDEALRQLYLARRSHRTFALTPIPLDQFGGFLSCLYQIVLDGTPKYRYGSPGGLYPLQTYLHIKPGRVEGVAPGTYYYHPIDHRLVALHPNAEIDRSIHVPFVNTPTFDEAAFSILLIAQMSALAPGYGEHSLHFATLEAGVMAHLLETSAPAHGIGLCQIGSIEFDRIRHLFDLEPSHVLIHSLLGGPIAPESNGRAAAPATAAQGDAARVASALERIKQLTPEQVKALLAANRAK